MGKRLLLCLLCLVLIPALGGCWNYTSLDQINIVVGIAVDFDKEANLYNLTYEVADLTGGEKESNTKGKILVSQGKTLFDAARNAKRKEADKLFFGSAYTLIISQEVARDIGMLPIIDWFLRDGECRETMCVSLSQAETAGAILENSEGMNGLVSMYLHDIIVEDKKVTASSVHKRLYEVYDMLMSPRNSTVLSAWHIIEQGDQKVNESNGIAVCKGDKLAGYLTPEESKYALFVADELQGGLLTLSLAGRETDDITLEIISSNTKTSFTHDQGKVKVRIETYTEVVIAENQGELDIMYEDVVNGVEAAAAEMIEANTLKMLAKVQEVYHADIFGFGEMIYKRDLPLWRQLEASWEEMYPTLEVEVASKVQVISSAFIR